MKRRKVYTTEFKQEAIRLIEQPRANVQRIANDLRVFEVQNPKDIHQSKDYGILYLKRIIACMLGEKQHRFREGYCFQDMGK
jgi:hypothetical protein